MKFSALSPGKKLFLCGGPSSTFVPHSLPFLEMGVSFAENVMRRLSKFEGWMEVADSATLWS